VMGISLPSTTQFYWGLSGGFIVFFIFALVPFVYAFAGMLRDTPVLSGVRDAVRSNAYLSLVLIGFCALTLILIKRPGYDKLWYKNLKVNDKIDMVNHTQEVNLSSSEYLKGLNISHGGIDTAVTTKITSLSIQPHTALDTTWFHLDRKENKTQSGDTVTYDIMLTLLSKFRPFQMVVSYDGGKDDPSNFSSTLFYRNRSHHDTFTWYSFPDTNVILPVKFSVIGQDTVHETISVMFDTLAYPMKFLAEKTYEIPRTEYVSEKTYKK